MKIANNITELIGNTPLVKLSKIAPEIDANLVAKLESLNPGGSVKDRIGLSMIEAAEKEGSLKPGSIIIEPTSGNTGIGLAITCAVKGYALILTMPDTMSVERRNLLKAYGAQLELTSGSKGMKGTIEKSEELHKNIPGSILLQQFKNKANPDIHRQTTAQEIWRDTDGQIDVFIAGIGTGGTITGVGETLKKLNPNIKTIAVEPEDSPVLSGGTPGQHIIQGIGAGFVPDILNTSIYDEIIKISNQDATDTAKKLATKEGLLVGFSAGAAAYAAISVAKRPENKKKTIVFIAPDTGERYLSII
jgi:cysteine synthase